MRLALERRLCPRLIGTRRNCFRTGAGRWCRLGIRARSRGKLSTCCGMRGGGIRSARAPTRLGADSAQVRALATRYAAFLFHAYNAKVRQFRNFMSFDRRWLEEAGSEDCNGRTLWALGMCVGRSHRPSFQQLAGDLFHGALPGAVEFKAPRAWAFSLLGIQEYLQRLSGDRLAEQIRDSLAGRLIQLFE